MFSLSGRDEPFYGLLKVPRSAAFPDCAVHELLIRLCKLRGDAAEDHQDASAVDLSVVLGNVVFINRDKFLLNPAKLKYTKLA